MVRFSFVAKQVTSIFRKYPMVITSFLENDFMKPAQRNNVNFKAQSRFYK